MQNNTETFIYLGATPEIADDPNLAFKVVAPTNALFEDEWAFNGRRNANNELIGNFVGEEPVYKQNMEWELIKKEDWWALNRFKKAQRNKFYVKFFNHNLGYWQIYTFYAGNSKVNPKNINKNTGAPDIYYHNAVMNAVDTGAR